MSRPEPHEWAETLCRHRHGLTTGPACDWCQVAAEALAPLIDREREAAKAEGMAAVAGPVLAVLADWGGGPEGSGTDFAEAIHDSGAWRFDRDLRAAIPTDATGALARVRAEAKAEALREAAAWVAEHVGYPVEVKLDAPMPDALWEALVTHIHEDRDGRWHGRELTRDETDSWLRDEAGRPAAHEAGTGGES